MPLRDHFHPPLVNRRHWEGIHSAWINAMVRRLSEQLPPRYLAEPQVHLGAFVEPDVANFEDQTPGLAVSSDGNGVATAVWAPPQPTSTLAVDFAGRDVYEVRILDEARALRLVAVVELVSPRNKDRPESRRDFAVKVASYWQERIGVVVIDVVSSRHTNLYAETLRHLGLIDPALDEEPGPLCAVACRTSKAEAAWHLDTWLHPLTFGAALPTLPLWLASDLAVPLDLEASYEETCRILRIG
jgi:hypothetical protein